MGMLVDVLVPLSMLAMGFSFLALLLLLGGRRLTAAITALIAIALCYVVAAGWMQPQAIAGVSMSGEAVVVDLESERSLSGIFMGLTFLNFFTFGAAAMSIFVEVFEREE